jgi:phage anti-repressor protein
MNQLIKVNYDNDKQTVWGRELHEFLEVATQYKDWFPRMSEYGFIEGIDFCSILSESTGGRPSVDHQVTIDMAKEISMLQRNDKGKQARQYFIQIEKAWNSPESVMARAIRMAEVKLLSLQNTVELLNTENRLLSQQTLTWADRKIIDALVKKYGNKIGFEFAWREYKKELLYKHSINLNSRLTEKINSTGRKNFKTLDMIHEDELSACISSAVALCKNNNIDIADVIKRYNIPA